MIRYRTIRHRLRTAPVLLGFGLSACLAVAPSALAATPAEVNNAIKNAVTYLKKTQTPMMWEMAATPDAKGFMPNGFVSDAAQFGGRTALSTYALLAAGESDQGPELQKAITWLSAADLHGTYAAALRSQVWLLTPETKERNLLRDRDKEFILDSLIPKGPNAGFYGYSYGTVSAPRGASTAASASTAKPAPAAGGAKQLNPGVDKKGPPADYWFDRSNSQYGVLGAWALEQANAEIPQKYWETVDKAWKAAQFPDGAWNYANSGEWLKTSVTMTEAGLATLFITQDYMLRGHPWEPCSGGVPNTHIDNALTWMDKHINEGVAQGNLYAMYGVERIGVASGRKYFGTTDWFKVGAEYLVRNQNPDGSFRAGASNGPGPDTCFGLLFLARGRAPIMMNKLEYAFKKGDDNWNERPRDTANLAKWMGSRVESSLNWQVVNLKVSMDDLHDAPILYLSGNTELKFTPEEIVKLRTFVDQGGMILGNPDCDNQAFAKSFEALGTQLFKGYEFRDVPANHPIFTNETFTGKKWRVHPKLRGLTNGVRELMIMAPDSDLSRAWQTDSNQTRRESFELAADIFLYSVDKKNLRFKGETYIVEPNTTAAASHIKVARIETDTNWNPEPGGWPRLSAVMHNTLKTDLDVVPVKLGEGKLAAGGFKVADLTGTTRIKFSQAQRDELKEFVQKGGTLVIDAAGGSTEFADSAEAELTAIFGDVATKGLARPLTFSSAVFSTGSRITELGFRQFARRVIVGSNKVCRLKGIPFGNRIGVFMSREDISAALVGQAVDGIVGYDPESGTRLMTNIMMYADGAPPLPAPVAPPPVAAK